MKNLLRVLLSTFVLMLSMGVAFAFPDVSDSHWAASQIKELSEQGVIVGEDDGHEAS